MASVASGAEATALNEQKALLVQAAEPEKQPQGEKKKETFKSPEGKPLLTPEDVIKRRYGETFGETILKYGESEAATRLERTLIKPMILAFIPPLLESAVVGNAFVLPPNAFRASVDYAFTNLTGKDDFAGGTAAGNFNGVRRQFVNLTLAYGFDLNMKYLHSFTAALVIPYQSTNSRGFVQPAGAGGPEVLNNGSVGTLGDITLLVKKKLIDQGSFPNIPFVPKVGFAMAAGVFFPSGSNSEKFGNDGVVGCRGAGCPAANFTFTRFGDDGRLPSVLQPGNGVPSYLLGGFVTRQFQPGDFAFLAGSPLDRGAIHLGGVHRWNFESNGVDPGGLTTVFASLVAPVYKDYVSLEASNIWQIQEEDSYRGTFGGAPRAPFTRGSLGLLGPSLIFSPDPQIRFRATGLFRVKEPELGPSPPFVMNFGIDVTF
jgi:hypothetical protein